MSNNLSIDEQLRILHDGKVSDEEMQYILRVKQASGIRNNDELFTVLLLTTHISEAINSTKQEMKDAVNELSYAPDKLRDVSRDVVNNYRETAKIAIEEASEIGLKELAKSVSNVANKVARQTATKLMWQWAFFCITISLLALTGAGFVSFSAGQTSGYNLRQQAEIVEKSAAASNNICPQPTDNSKNGSRKKQ
jgi:hypothetical protein